MDNSEVAVNSARFSYRAATAYGHAAGCAVVWRVGQCSCPGRAAILGRAGARAAEQSEDRWLCYLREVDPRASSWIDSSRAPSDQLGSAARYGP